MMVRWLKLRPKVGLVKGACEHCRGHLQFSSEAMGQVIECPHCKGKTKLMQDQLLTATPSQKRSKSLPVGILVGAQTTPPTGSASNGARLEAELKAIAHLKEQGLITEADYEEKKRKLLGI